MQDLFYVFLLLFVHIIVMRCNMCSEDLYCATYTPSGIIRGVYDTTRLGRKFESYRGIRYAEPPVGDLRFQPPKLIQKYSGTVDATKDGPVCPQANNTGPYKFMDEDCLRINVFTPLKKDRIHLLPVVVYVHQSAFYVGAACSYFYGPNYLLDRDIVLVTFNYRLGSLGFISTGDEFAPGNNGLKDQVTALRWVQRNIAAFGGDPNCVTLTGYSSGSTSVAVHLVSPMSKGLFHRAISMSGSPTTLEKTPTDLYNYAVKQAQLVNCPTYNSKVIIECLKTKPWKDISKTYNGFFIFGRNPIHLWGPIVEKDFGQERFLTMDPIVAIKDGNMINVPYIISQNEAEFYPYVIALLENNTQLSRLNEDWNQTAPMVFLLPEKNITSALSELRSIYIQNRPLRYNEESIERLGTLFSDSVVAYPVNRDPNPQKETPELKGLVWPAMTPVNRTYLQLSNELTLHQNFREKRLQIWEKLYPIQY